MPGQIIDDRYTNGMGIGAAMEISSAPTTGITTACVWRLQPPQEDVVSKQVPANTEVLYNGRRNLESVIGRDDRVLVDDEDIMPGGKYRAIVKLFLHFDGQDENEFAMATGWLIADDMVVTAGHCSFDHSHGFDRLLRANVYMGYKGKESTIDPNIKSKLDVQLRTGRVITTTSDWLSKGNDEARDVAFILLDKPFNDITPFKPHDTPETGSYFIGVVGYPGDLEDPQTHERGAFMYENFGNDTYDFETAVSKKDHLLQYKVDTFGGNSGSPVLVRFQGSDNLVPIGVHVYGGDQNSASMIGPHGNDFSTYTAALKLFDSNSTSVLMHTDDPTRPWLTYVDIPSTNTPNSPTDPNNNNNPNNNGTTESYSDGPGTLGGTIPGTNPAFLATLNKAMSIVSQTNNSTTEFLDPTHPRIILNKSMNKIAPPVAALSALALHVAGKIAASTGTESSSSPSSIKPSYSFEGAAERAALAEAAIEAIRHMGNKKCLELGIFKTMTGIVADLTPAVTGVAPKILPGAMTEPALRIALDHLARATSPAEGHESYETPAGRKVREMKDLEKEVEYKSVGYIPPQEMAEFAVGFKEVCTRENAQEFLGLTTTIGKVIGKGLRLIGPILGTVAKVGLGLLLGGGEAETEADGEGKGSSRNMFEGYAERTIVGEAALRAVVGLGSEKCFEEGVYQVMTDFLSKVAPVVIRTAPVVIRAVTPIVQDVLAQKRAARHGGGIELNFDHTLAIPADPDLPVNGWPVMEDVEERQIRTAEGFSGDIRALDTPGGGDANPVETEASQRILQLGGNEAARLGRKTVLSALDQYKAFIDTKDRARAWKDFIRTSPRFYDVFGAHPPLYGAVFNGNPPNMMDMFNFTDLQGPYDRNMQFVDLCRLPSGFWRLVVGLLRGNMGRVSYVAPEGGNQARVEFVITSKLAGDPPIVIAMSVWAYCWILRMMMRGFIRNTTLGHDLGDWHD